MLVTLAFDSNIKTRISDQLLGVPFRPNPEIPLLVRDTKEDGRKYIWACLETGEDSSGRNKDKNFFTR